MGYWRGRMGPCVGFILQGGGTAEVGPGELIGRSAAAHLRIDDPRVSEAHALVSLRSGAFRLLALRGRFAVEGQARTDLELAVGQQIELARDLVLHVVEVVLPTQVLALEGDLLPRQVLVGVTSLVMDPQPALVRQFASEAAAWLWNSGDTSWALQIAGQAQRPLLAGDQWTLQGQQFRCVAVQLVEIAVHATAGDGGLAVPVKIVAHYETVHIFRERRTPLVLDGLYARLVSELGVFGGPVAWELLAGELWKDESDRQRVRRRLDLAVSRLRQRLRDHGVRPDLGRMSGGGQVEVFLHERDQVVDAA